MISKAKALKTVDPYIKLLVLYSVVIYLMEIVTGQRDHKFFVWSEIVIGTLFTIEYIFRWLDDLNDNVGWHYPHSPLGFIDLISIVPFWAGLFAPPQFSHLIETLKVFRLLKFFRYSRSLQLVALGFYRAGPALKPLLFSQFIIGLFCTVAIFEIESPAQPEKFTNLLDAAYFTMVTVATVGYGDLSPITPLGRILAMFTFMTALAIFAGILGVLGSSFFKVMEEEIDPNIDPLEEFHKEKEKRMLLKMKK